jgi:spore coat polysaccharide biosynthesis protein SpsF
MVIKPSVNIEGLNATNVTNISVQARLNSTRLPGKVLLMLGSDRVLNHVVTRCEATDSSDETIVATGDRPENEAIVEWCRRRGTPVRVGPEDDLLERHLRVARRTNDDELVRVTGDCPFVPSDEIDRVIDRHDANDAQYTTNAVDGMPIGTAVDVVDVPLLEELSELGETHPISLPRNEPDDWQVEFTPNDDLLAYGDAHTAVDTPDDYWTLVDAVDAVGTDPYAVTEWVAENQ